MKRFIITYVLVLLTIVVGAKSRVAIIATGGTIAGAGETKASAGYTPAQVSVNVLLEQVPELQEIAEIVPIQLCNISSQNMSFEICTKLALLIDSLFVNNVVDGVVVTHGTDTMEETAYFLNSTVVHRQPIVMTGAMRPSTSIGADGPMNLYNAVTVAASKCSGKGVMVVVNEMILGADDVTKVNTTNVHAFESPNYGPLGTVRGTSVIFFREQNGEHTYKSPFNVTKLPKKLPKVEIINSYISADATLFEAAVKSGAKGVVIAGVGHGNATEAIMEYAAKVAKKGIAVVRSSRVLRGGVTTELENPFEGEIPAMYLSAQKARIQLMLKLSVK
jgi:L-asparaginase